MSTIRLVTRADDAGMHTVVNEAIAETVTKGIVRNVSLMAPAPGIRNSFQLLGGLSDKIDFGLHVTLTSEWANVRWRPLHDGETEAICRSDGTMHFSVADLEKTDPDIDLLLAEVGAQYELLTNLGFKLSYLDEHMNVGAIPGLAQALEKFAADHSLIYDRALHGDKLTAFPAWDGPGEHPGTELADQLSTMAAGTYLLVGHPATKDEALHRIHLKDESQGEMVRRRNRQRRMFMDIEIVDYCENVGIDLCRYSQV